MANRYTVTSGLASANSTWDGGASVPGTGDRVLICAGHTVTVDGTREWGDDSNSSITVNGVSTDHSVTVEGTLAYSTAANTQLTLNGRMEVRAGATYRQGTRTTPVPVTYTSKLLLNKSASLSDGQYGVNIRAGAYVDIYGFTKTRIATLTATANAAASTIYVDDATGWQIGDEVYLANTKGNDASHFDVCVIAGSYTPGSLTVPLTAALSYQHLIECPCANLTNSVTIQNYDPDYRGYFRIYTATTSVVDSMDIGYCTFDNLGYSGDGHYGLTLLTSNNPSGLDYYPAQHKVFQSVACVARIEYRQALAVFGITRLTTPIPFADCALISTSTGNARAIIDSSYTSYTDCMAAAGEILDVDEDVSWSGSWTRGWLACTGDGGSPSITVNNARNIRMNGATFLGPGLTHAVAASVAGPGPSNWELVDCDIAGTFPRETGRNPVRLTTSASDITATFRGCNTSTYRQISTGSQLGMSATSFIKAINKNGDITLQEEYYRDGTILRDNSEKRRSTSSLSMTPSTAGRAFTRSFTISVAAGEVLRLVGYCKYDSTYYNSGTGFVAPTMTLSGTINGVTLTPVVYTAAGANAGNWDLIDASITNSSGAPGEITVTFSTQCTPTTGLVYWDGIVVAPFVVTARHYGFVFDEANPKRVVNGAVVVSESTAAAYTGVTINTGTPQITVASGTANTFQKVYDYIQAWACLNLTSTVYLTTLDKTNFSIPLACKLEWAGMGADGTLVGGWLLLEAGTHNYKLSGTKIDFTEVGDYNMGGTTFSGTVELVNSSVGAVTVSLPSGVSYTNTGPSITVSVASATLTIAANISLVGAEVRIYDLDNTPTGSLGTELAGTESAPSSTYAYSGTGGNVVWVQILAAGYEEFGQELTLPATSTTFTALLRLDSNA